MVFIDRVVANCPCDTIITSDYDAIHQGIERLIQKGHTRIGHLAGLARLFPIRERMSAYEEVMHENSLPIKDGYVRYIDSVFTSAAALVPPMIEQPCTELGRRAGLQILQRIENPSSPVSNMVIPSVLVKCSAY